MFKKYGLTWGELPWLVIEGFIKAFLVIFPGKKMTVEEYNQEGPRNYVPHKDR